MRQFLITVAGTVFGIFACFIILLFIIMFFGLVGSIAHSLKPKNSYVLSLDLRKPIRDQSSANTLFGPPQASTVSIVRSLHAAKTDSSIKGLFIRARNFGMTPASAEELRLAIKDFQTSGKFVITHSQGFESTSVTGYQTVSASDEIWQQDTTSFAVAGLGSEVPFYGGVFKKFDIKPQFEQFYEFKNAVNSYTQTGFTDAHREALNSLLSSLYDTAVEEIAADRKIERTELERLFKAAPLTPKSAKAAGLIDKVGHIQEAQDYVIKKAGGKHVKFKPMRSYTPNSAGTGPVIALIGGQGPVVPGRSADGASPFNPAITMGSDTLSKAFEAAIKDKKVKAILFRVSTPGGSATASDQIYNAVSRAQDGGKPVIISMGQYAASGGYFVSAGADKIVALPNTITGSIGVYGGKLALRDAYARLGYNVDSIAVGGDYVGVYSSDEPFTQTQQAGFHRQLEEIYKDFTGKVAKGRNLPLERVREIAKGRVWTGKQAKELGLVDEFGGLFKAIDVAKEVADIDKNTKIRLKSYPRPKSFEQQVSEMFEGAASAKADLATLQKITNLPEVKALIEARKRTETGQELRALLPQIK